MEKNAIAANGVLLKYPNPGERLEVFRCSLALGNTSFDDVADSTVRLAENHIE